MSRGGYRPGAGRKKKDRTGQQFYENALEYLKAVTQGDVEPDALRISAAKAVLPYEAPKQRTKVKSDRPDQLRQKEERAIEENNLLIFEEKAAKIRAKYNKRKAINDNCLHKPYAQKYRTITPLYRPVIPPIFQDIGPEGVTEDDRKQARELFLLLDKESQQWYQIHCKWLSGNDFEKTYEIKKIKKQVEKSKVSK